MTRNKGVLESDGLIFQRKLILPELNIICFDFD